jgi:hypothetical protein
MFKGSFPPRILDFKGFTHMSLSIPRPWMKMMAGLSILPLVKAMSNFIFQDGNNLLDKCNKKGVVSATP